MQVRLAVLADAANQSSDGKLNILGEFNLIWASAFPVVWTRMFLVLKVEAEPGEVPRRRLRIRVVDEDATPVAPSLEGEIDLSQRFKPGVPPAGTFILEFRNAAFSKPGTYEFEIVVDDLPLTSVPLYVFPSEERTPPAA